LSDVAILKKYKGQFAEKLLLIEKICSFLIVQNLLYFSENSQTFGNFKLNYFHTWIIFFFHASKNWIQNSTFHNSDKQNVTIWRKHVLLQPY